MNKATRRRVALLLAAVALSVVAWVGFKKLRGLMMLGYVDSAIMRLREVGVAEAEFANDLMEWTHPDETMGAAAL